MRECRQRLALLVRWNISRYEVNAGKTAAIACRTRQRKVPTVDGIERAAKEPNIHARLVS